MSSLSQIVVSNALHATFLAAAVFVLTRFWKNPHAARALWLCVMLKLLVPPLVHVPVAALVETPPCWDFEDRPRPERTADVDRQARSDTIDRHESSVEGGVVDSRSVLAADDAALDAALRDSSRGPQAPAESLHALSAPRDHSSGDATANHPREVSVSPGRLPVEDTLGDSTEDQSAIDEEFGPASERSADDSTAESADFRPRPPGGARLGEAAVLAANVLEGIVACLPAVWVAGSSVWLLIVVGRIARFAGMVRRLAVADPGVLAETQVLAHRVGLSRVPLVRVVECSFPPVLWSLWGTPTIVLPGALLRRLGRQERRSLLLHELAHLKRGDHRIRWFESVVMAIYWWHPVAWWARREVHIAEELCCDALVVHYLPDAACSYGQALIETVDFLSERSPALPALASGFGSFRSLKWRLQMIIDRRVPCRLSWPGWLIVAAVALFVLPAAAQNAPTVVPVAPPASLPSQPGEAPLAQDPSSGSPSVPMALPVPTAPTAPPADKVPTTPANPLAGVGGAPTQREAAPLDSSLSPPPPHRGIPGTPPVPPRSAPLAPVISDEFSRTPAPATVEERLARLERMMERLLQGTADGSVRPSLPPSRADDVDSRLPHSPPTGSGRIVPRTPDSYEPEQPRESRDLRNAELRQLEDQARQLQDRIEALRNDLRSSERRRQVQEKPLLRRPKRDLRDQPVETELPGTTEPGRPAPIQPSSERTAAERLRYVDAQALSETLAELLPDARNLRIVVERRTNTLLISGEHRQVDLIQQIIRRLDREPPDQRGTSIDENIQRVPVPDQDLKTKPSDPLVSPNQSFSARIEQGNRLILHEDLSGNMQGPVEKETTLLPLDLKNFTGERTDGGTISALRFAPDSRWLYVGQADGFVRCFSTETGKLVWEHRAEQPVIDLSCLSTEKEGGLLGVVLQGLVEGTLWIDPQTGRRVHRG